MASANQSSFRLDSHILQQLHARKLVHHANSLSRISLHVIIVTIFVSIGLKKFAEDIYLHKIALTMTKQLYTIQWLFSIGANFPEFPKWTHNSGKFILECCVKFDYGLLLELGTTVVAISLVLTCCIQFRTRLSSKTFLLQLQLLMLKLQITTVGVISGYSIQTL